MRPVARMWRPRLSVSALWRRSSCRPCPYLPHLKCLIVVGAVVAVIGVLVDLASACAHNAACTVICGPQVERCLSVPHHICSPIAPHKGNRALSLLVVSPFARQPQDLEGEVVG